MKRPLEPDSDDDSQQEVVNNSEEDPEAFNSDGKMDDSEQEFVSDSQEEDPEASKLLDDIKSQIYNSLEQMSSAMSFASSGPCPSTENPGIWIPDVGIIGLPLSERDVDLISKVTHPAPYGMGPDTIVDLTVRNTQELNPEQFELRNPKWDMALENIVRQAAVDLGVLGKPSGVKAELYKILLYGEGSMFKEHRESVSQRITVFGPS
jgi:hypothetical protein